MYPHFFTSSLAFRFYFVNKFYEMFLKKNFIQIEIDDLNVFMPFSCHIIPLYRCFYSTAKYSIKYNSTVTVCACAFLSFSSANLPKRKAMENAIQTVNVEKSFSVFFLSNIKQRIEERNVSRWKRDAREENGMRSNNSSNSSKKSGSKQISKCS